MDDNVDSGRLLEAVEHILDDELRATPEREIVLVYDDAKVRVALALRAELARRQQSVTELRIYDDLDAKEDQLDAILTNRDVALIVLASHAMWQGLDLHRHFTFRDGKPSLRCDCHPVFFDAAIPEDSLIRLYSVDPDETAAYLAHVQARLPDHAPLRITAPGGTDLQLTPRQWIAEGWELTTLPVEATPTGRIVVDGAVFFAPVRTPIELHIDEGRLIAISCSDPDDSVFEQYVVWMEEVLVGNPANWQVAEIGIGGNSHAQISSVVMESEAVQGTFHICFGDNVMFAAGGENATGWHGGTVVVRNPTFTVGEM